MPNPIKYSTSAQTLALKKGNFWIGTGDVGKGPTSVTDYYNGITPPSGGYTIYLNKASGGPSIYTAANDSQLVSLTNTISYITTNYISNGGNFANGTSSPFLYDYSGAGGVGQIVSIANDKPYAGSTSTNALELNYNGGKWMDTAGLLTVGQTYTFSFWAKITSGSSFAIGWNNQNGQGETNSWSSGGFSLTTSWKRYSQVFTYNAARNQFYFSTRNQTVGTLAVFTEFQLSLGSAPCGPGLTTATESINWFLTQTDKMVLNADYPSIITDGLILNLDAGSTPSVTSPLTNIVGGSYGSYTPGWYDLSSNSTTGALYNGPTFSSSNGGTLVFDGVDDFSDVPFSYSVYNGGNIQPFSMEVWVKHAYVDLSSGEYFAGFYGANRFMGCVLGYTKTGATTSLRFNAMYGGVGGNEQSIYVAQDQQWHCFVMTYSSSSFSSLYVDGVLKTSGTVSASSNAFFTEIRIAKNRGAECIPITLSSLRCYSKQLSQAEITRNYNAQKSRYGL